MARDLFASPPQQTPNGQPRDLFAAKPERVGVLEGMGYGAKGALDAAAQMLVHALPNGLVESVNKRLGPELAPTAQQMDKQIADNERQYQYRRSSNDQTGLDVPRLVGGIAATAPLAMALPSGATTLTGAALQGATGGAALGSLTPVTDDTKGFAEQKAGQVGVGAATGGLFQPLMNLLGKVVSPAVDKSVKYLQERGVTPLPGQVMGGAAKRIEEKATSIPIVGDAITSAQRKAVEQFNVAAYNEALKPIGETFSGNAGRESLKAVRARLSAAYENLLPSLKFTADADFITDMQNVGGMAQLMTPDKLKQFTTIMENELRPRITGQGVMDGTTVKAFENEMTRHIGRFSKSSSADDQILADALRDVLGAVRSNLTRVNPQQAERLSNINRGWAMYARIRDAASRVGSEEGVFTPAQLYSAIRSADKSAGKGAFAEGDSLLQPLADAAKKVIGNKYPDSGTPGRLLQGGIAAGGLGMLDPTLLGATAGAAGMYTNPGRAALVAAMTKRPDFAPQVAAGLRKAAVPGYAALIAAAGVR